MTFRSLFQFDGRGLFRIDAEGKGDVFTAAEIDFEQLPRSGRNYYFLNVTVMVRMLYAIVLSNTH